MSTRNGYIRVYEESGLGVVPPFLVAEVAGSLAVDEDRKQLKTYAETILEWLAKTERPDGAKICPLVRS